MAFGNGFGCSPIKTIETEIVTPTIPNGTAYETDITIAGVTNENYISTAYSLTSLPSGVWINEFVMNGTMRLTITNETGVDISLPAFSFEVKFFNQ